MSKITINLSDEVSVDVDYLLEDNEVVITDIKLLEGTLFDLIQALDYEGDIFTALSNQINDELILEFGKLELDNDEDLDN